MKGWRSNTRTGNAVAGCGGCDGDADEVGILIREAQMKMFITETPGTALGAWG